MTHKNDVLLNKNANQDIIIDQYKILTDSINTNNQLRETANNFWVTVNSLGLSTIAYIKDNTNLSSDQRPFIIWVLVFVGIILCCSWLSYLTTIKKNIDERYSLLFVMEQYLPLPMFQIFLKQTGDERNRNSLTLREMFVPVSFLLGYIFLGTILIFFNQ